VQVRLAPVQAANLPLGFSRALSSQGKIPLLRSTNVNIGDAETSDNLCLSLPPLFVGGNGLSFVGGNGLSLGLSQSLQMAVALAG
jgi:hypothetical protein